MNFFFLVEELLFVQKERQAFSCFSRFFLQTLDTLGTAAQGIKWQHLWFLIPKRTRIAASHGSMLCQQRLSVRRRDKVSVVGSL